MSHTQDRWETHWDAGHNWAIVLAAGEGTRLHALTMTASGVAVPKQFCSLGGGSSLLHGAIRRAQAIAPPERTCAVVADHHRRWWQALPLDIPATNLIAQPRNCGTANGILLPLLHVLHRDPDAAVLVLPSDHYVRNESVLALSLRRAMAELQHERGHLILLGMAPDEPDRELGYIVGESGDGSDIRTVAEFVEKPGAAKARDLIAQGALWNSFIFAATGRTLLRAFEECCPDLVGEMLHIVSSPAEFATRAARLASLYEDLPELDFSRDILERSPSLLRVLTVPACGWSDLGTPRRVGETVGRYRSTPDALLSTSPGKMAFVDLAARHRQMQAG